MYSTFLLECGINLFIWIAPKSKLKIKGDIQLKDAETSLA